MSDLDRKPEDEAAIQSMLNEDGSMNGTFVHVYVQDGIIRHLEQEAAAFRGMAADEAVPEVDRKDAEACAAKCDELARAIRLSNTALLSTRQLVQVADALPPGLPAIVVPGSRLPGVKG